MVFHIRLTVRRVHAGTLFLFMNYKLNDDLSLSKTWSYKKAFYVSLVINAFLVLTGIYMDRNEILYKTRTIFVWGDSTEKSDLILTDSSVLNELVKSGCVLPTVALAQAKLESGLGKSQVGKNAKNLFGITHHKCKYVHGKYGVYASYKTYRDNIKCYIHIQDNYLKNIDGRYAEDPGYTTKIKSMK